MADFDRNMDQQVAAGTIQCCDCISGDTHTLLDRDDRAAGVVSTPDLLVDGGVPIGAS
ncbi:uncharacterized protein METZ01_LOCUS175599 [marine metagenome]|uniref:Uncharacterized protein n=1 Tax=marine metagenome TaxID=408172 RepID=A0A382C9F7_9ZZZZ